jgi:hypothetical protein
LKDSAPYVLSNEIGFKVITRSEDGYKAIAAVAVSLGNKIGYIIFLFDSGDLKVKELLLIPSLDLVVPLTQEWVQHISSGVDDNFADLIKDTDINVASPDISPFKFSPVKRASWEEIDKALNDNSLIPEIKKLVKEPAFGYSVINFIYKSADWIKFCRDRYGLDFIKDAAKSYIEYKNRIDKKYNWIYEEPKIEKRSSSLEIYKLEPNRTYPTLNSEQKSILLTRGFYINDKRPDSEIFTPKRINLEKAAATYYEPFKSGIYEEDDKYCLFLKNGRLFEPVCCCAGDSKKYRRFRKGIKLLIKGNSTKFTDPTVSILFNIDYKMNNPDSDLAEQTLNDFIDKLPTLEKYIKNNAGSSGDRRLNGKATCLLIIDPKSKEWILITLDKVNKDFIKGHHEHHEIHIIPSSAEKAYLMDYGQENKFYFAVPKTYKVFKFNMDHDNEIYNLFEGDYDAKAQMVTNDNLDKLVEKGAAFKVSYVDQTYYLNKKAYSDYKDFVIDLVKDYNLRQNDAEMIAVKANFEPDYYVVLYNGDLVKTAQLPTMGAGMPMAAPTGQPAPTPAPGMGMDMYGAGVMPGQGQQMMPDQQLTQTMNTEQPQVKDTAIISSMANSASTEQIVDKYLPTLLKAINALGRLLLNLNWHFDKLVERYGEQELSAIIDSARASFMRLGEIYLKLKEKSFSTEFAERPEYLLKAEQT